VRGCEKESGTGRRFPASQIRERGASARCLSRRAWRSQPSSASPRAPPARLAHALPARPPPPPRCARTPPSLTLPSLSLSPPTTQPPPRRPGRPARLHPGPPCPGRHRRLGRQVPGLRLMPRGSGRGRVPGEDARVSDVVERRRRVRERPAPAPLSSPLSCSPRLSLTHTRTLFSLSPLLQARRRPQRGLLLPGQGQLGPA
jgi:hypothetical protein